MKEDCPIAHCDDPIHRIFARRATAPGRLAVASAQEETGHMTMARIVFAVACANCGMVSSLDEARCSGAHSSPPVQHAGRCYGCGVPFENFAQVLEQIPALDHVLQTYGDHREEHP